MKQILRWLLQYAYSPKAAGLRSELRGIGNSLWTLGQQDSNNDVLASEIRLRLSRIQRELQQLASGRLRFEGTETWRTAYEEALSRCEAKRYLSAAIVRNEDYWQDVPGKKSMDFNRLLLEHNFYIHRILIVDDFLWPTAAKTPGKPLMSWISDQYTAGIQIGLLRMSELEEEADLLRDFGIYGNEAVGHQHTDLQSRTLRYELSFHEADIRLAEDRWKRLSLYVTPFERIQEAELA